MKGLAIIAHLFVRASTLQRKRAILTVAAIAWGTVAILMLLAFGEGEDIHRYTASRVFGVPLDRVETEMRRKAKAGFIMAGLVVGVAAMVAVREFAEGRFVVLAARSGYIKKTPLSAFSRPRADGIIAVNIEEGDELLAASLSGGGDEIFMATARGQSIRFNEKDVRAMGRNARGVIGIRMSKEDQCVGMEVLSGKPDMLTVSANGYGKRTPIEDHWAGLRPGSPSGIPYIGPYPGADGLYVNAGHFRNGVVNLAVRNTLPQGASAAARAGNQMAQDNVRQRLDAAFGDAAGMVLGQVDGCYQVRLHFPATSS